MSDTSKPRELHGIRRFGYNLGYFGIFLGNLLIGVFAFQFYVYTVNLSSILVSIGLFLNLFVGSIFAIVFGVVIDNKKPGKYGKRKVFLIYGLPIWFLASILIWMPPWPCPKDNQFYLPTAIYFWSIISLQAIFGTLILIAHGSMLPEQSQTEKNRKKVASVGTFLAIIGSIISVLFPLIIQSVLDEPQNAKWWHPSGKIILQYMPIVALLLALFGVFSILLMFFVIDESFHFETQSENIEKKAIRDTFQQMKLPAKDKKYRKLVMVSFFTQYGGRVIGLVIIPFLTYVLLFEGPQYFIYILVSISCKFGWYYVWKKILEKHDLITTYRWCITVSALFSFLELVFLLNILNFSWNIALFVITYGTVLGAIYALGLFPGPIGSALIDEAARNTIDKDQTLSVSEISGSYSGLSLFMISMGQAIASIMIGFILIGENAENPVILTISLASAGLFYLFSLIFLRKIELDSVGS